MMGVRDAVYNKIVIQEEKEKIEIIPSHQTGKERREEMGMGMEWLILNLVWAMQRVSGMKMESQR